MSFKIKYSGLVAIILQIKVFIPGIDELYRLEKFLIAHHPEKLVKIE